MRPIDCTDAKRLEFCLCVAISLLTEGQRKSFVRLAAGPVPLGLPFDLRGYAKNALHRNRVKRRP